MDSVQRSILLVEDNPDDVKLALRAFQQSNIVNPIAIVNDGVEALDFLFARGVYSDRADKPLPALVLLDLKLPLVDGLGVLRAVRADERTRLVPVVIMTSSQEEQDVIASYSLGVNSFVRKPIDFNEFLEAAKVLGIYWLMLNQPPPERTTK